MDLLPAVEEAGFEWLDLSPREVHQLAELALLHRDPFDRMLIVQSQINDLTLVTDDSRIDGYDCRHKTLFDPKSESQLFALQDHG